MQSNQIQLGTVKEQFSLKLARQREQIWALG